MYLKSRVLKTVKPSVRKPTTFAAVVAVMALSILMLSRFVPNAWALTNSGTINLLNTPITEDFDGLGSSGSFAWNDNGSAAGWFAQFGTTANPTAYTASTGSSATGALYSFGSTTTPGDRALGSVGSGTTGDIYWAVKLTNNTGQTITSLDVSYAGEQWRAGGCTPTPCTPAAQTVDFQYQVANPGLVTDANTPIDGWLDHDPLDLTSPQVGTSSPATLDGNLPANRVLLNSTITLAVNPGQEIWLRWKDINHPNNDHGLAVDNFSATAHGGAVNTPTPTPTPSPTPTPTPTPSPSPSPTPGDHITISQVYGGGGNSNATYQNDYVELYNPTASTIDLTGWSVQYGAATGTSWQVQTIGGPLGPGQYFLVSLGSGGATGSPLPPANILGDINMSATAGKVALVSNGTPLSGCQQSAPVVDLVGYGSTANCREDGSNAPAPTSPNTNSTAIFRKNSGFTDTNVNGADFELGTPLPRRTAAITELGPWVASTDPFTNQTTAPKDDTIEVSFSEPVDAVGSWFNVTCASSGSHNSATIAHTPDSKIWAITPNTNFQYGEQCTVTVNKNAIHDLDADDSDPNTDTLFANYVWTFNVVQAGQPAPYPSNIHLTMGNPSNAIADISQPNNYLMEKEAYSLSYNRDKGTPNWVSWHLEPAWYGTLSRVDTFRPDPAVPADWYRVEGFDYTQSGFDRGHMTPNADRDNQNRLPINQATYLMSNMVPQAPDNNQGPWANLENDLRTLADAGNELYIVSGPAGQGGTGSNGFANTIVNGHVMVPSSTWKVALVIPKADGDDISRVNCAARTVAVNMPNVQGIRNNDWHMYLTTVDAVEQMTGYNFFSNLPGNIQACIETGTNGNNPPGTSDGMLGVNEDSFGIVDLSTLTTGPGTISFNVTQPAHGTVVLNSGSSYKYTPAGDYAGSDSFTFTAQNAYGTSNTSTVSVTVSPVNDAPVASSQAVTTGEDTPRSILLTANDVDGPSLTFTYSQPSHGTLSGTAPNLSYSPAADYNGPDSFTFTANDGSLESNIATVSLTISEINDAPTAAADSKTTAEDTPLVFSAGDLKANDLAGPANEAAQVLTVTGVLPSASTHGNVSLSAGQISYSPALNYNGPAYFSYSVCDNGTTSGAADPKCASGTVNLTVTPVNDAPVAQNDTATTNEDTLLQISVLSNDTDVDNDSLSVSGVTQGTHGSVANNGASVTYSPALNYNGSDSFTYIASDGHGGTAIATVNVSITPVNDAPVANSQPVTVVEDGSVAITLTASDVDSPTLSYAVVSGPLHGVLTGTGANRTYTPNANYDGPDSFTFKANDGSLDSNIATVSMAITPVNDATINYTGTQFILLPTAGSNGVATLSATVTEGIDNKLPGSTLAGKTLQFKVFKLSDLSMTSPLFTGTCSLAGLTAATAECGTTASLPADNYTVQVQLSPNLQYTAEIENAALTISDPGMTTGGGWLIDPHDPIGQHSNFSFTMKFQKNENAKGNSMFIYRTRTDLSSFGAPAGARAYDLVVKSNAVGTLEQSTTTTPQTASFEGKCNVKAVDRVTGLVYDLGGNYSFQVDVADPGQGSSGNDSYAIRVTNPSDQNFIVVGTYSVGVNTAQIAIGGGNIQIR